ncbi:FMN-binding negative transcriptional regulator [Tabrizicola oligotrophica]|uniref:FMN-binding negative transcriptional regulator n=1 Tax=Tabrizicola oligotrophica TaxID=2710650 RepID=A0A6M0QU89_9RHOB|nr:FMN-binding negative transcriptional regulator [Tabrizicola oligotrophica]NEY90213.1 FMN-binding negative transcriptional regulator [Tabrizicola oligotrophica]
MHPNPAFRQVPAEDSLAFARARGFGTLCVNGEAAGESGPLLAHVPFLVTETGGLCALVHLARSNAIARSALPAPAVIAVTGPESYISPDWYGSADQVPTWNYVAVHLRGRLEPLPLEALRPMVDDLSALFEARLLPKKPWVSSKMSDGVMERMLRMILPYRLVIEAVDGTWKLGQNKTPDQRAGAAAGLEGWAEASPRAELAALMRRVSG